jgi:hypothetical protein
MLSCFSILIFIIAIINFNMFLFFYCYYNYRFQLILNVIMTIMTYKGGFFWDLTSLLKADSACFRLHPSFLSEIWGSHNGECQLFSSGLWHHVVLYCNWLPTSQRNL